MQIEYCSSNEVQSFIHSGIVYDRKKEKVGSLQIKSTHISKYRFLIGIYLAKEWYFSNWASTEFYRIFHQDDKYKQRDIASLPCQSIQSHYICDEITLKIGAEIASFISNLNNNPFIHKTQHHNYQIFNQDRLLDLKYKLLWKEELIQLNKLTTNNDSAIISNRDILAITKSIKRV